MGHCPNQSFVNSKLTKHFYWLWVCNPHQYLRHVAYAWRRCWMLIKIRVGKKVALHWKCSHFIKIRGVLVYMICDPKEVWSAFERCYQTPWLIVLPILHWIDKPLPGALPFNNPLICCTILCHVPCACSLSRCSVMKAIRSLGSSWGLDQVQLLQKISHFNQATNEMLGLWKNTRMYSHQFCLEKIRIQNLPIMSPKKPSAVFCDLSSVT